MELFPGVREAVEGVAADYRIVLITMDYLIHHQSKVEQFSLGALFQRIEIVSQKTPEACAREVDEFGIDA